MSLSDYIKYLRAVKGGLTPWEIAEGSGVPAREVHLMEVKHRRVGDNEATLRKLSAFFGVPVEELTKRRNAFRKNLATFLDAHLEKEPVVLRLESSDELRGVVTWFGREALALAVDGGPEPYIVQRAWVADWRDASNPEWEAAHYTEADALGDDEDEDESASDAEAPVEIEVEAPRPARARAKAKAPAKTEKAG